MTVTSGFFNSLNHDRRYDSKQMSEIFDGVIEDGVYANIYNQFRVSANSIFDNSIEYFRHLFGIFDGVIEDGVYANIYNQFRVSANDGMTIQVDTGRSWFNHAWTKNDSILLIEVPKAEILFDRIDAVVIQVDHTEAGRNADNIIVVKGTPSSDPQKPTLQNGPDIFQHPIGYILVKAETTKIDQADITNVVGTSECPFVVGAAKSMDLDLFVNQLRAQWYQWFNNIKTTGEKELNEWMTETQFNFNLWFDSIQDMLDSNTAAKLANEILMLKNKFKTLVREYTIYDTIDDTDNEAIQDSYGNDIEGGIIYVIKE